MFKSHPIYSLALYITSFNDLFKIIILTLENMIYIRHYVYMLIIRYNIIIGIIPIVRISFILLNFNNGSNLTEKERV